MPSSVQVKQLVLAAKAGDDTAWRNLYEQYFPGMYAIALNRSQHPDDAVQETFITAFLKLHQLKEPAAFGGWLKAILRNYCFRESQRPVYPATEERERNPLDYYYNMLDEEQSGRLHVVLSKLSPSLQIVLLLRYYSSVIKYEDIARLLSLPVGTVRSRLHQARREISKLWHNDAPAGAERHNDAFNDFYRECFSDMHRQEASKQKFLNHLEKAVLIVRPGGQLVTGRNYFDQVIEGDRTSGSWLVPANIATAGDLSIIESIHYNSSQHPDHCPARSVLVLRRTNNFISELRFHPFYQS
jgi:RNA polymerase sigma factor (sigma-70 family)